MKKFLSFGILFLISTVLFAQDSTAVGNVTEDGTFNFPEWVDLIMGGLVTISALIAKFYPRVFAKITTPGLVNKSKSATELLTTVLEGIDVNSPGGVALTSDELRRVEAAVTKMQAAWGKPK